jgi:UDP-N-acetylglucosamine acyltransferase
MTTSVIQTQQQFESLASSGVIDAHGSALVEDGVGIVDGSRDRPIKLGENVIIESGATLYAGCLIGPGTTVSRNSSIGGDVELGSGNKILDQSIITGPVLIADDNIIGPFASIGQPLQHSQRLPVSEDGRVVIGSRNIIREFTTINQPTLTLTRVGDDNYLMAYVHVPHDADIGDFITITNSCQIAGGVHIHDHATLGLGATVHQRSTIGVGVMIAMGVAVSRDVPPYGTLGRVGIRGLNRFGMIRQGITKDQILELEDWYRLVEGKKLEDELDDVSDRWWYEVMVKFVEQSSRSRYSPSI